MDCRSLNLRRAGVAATLCALAAFATGPARAGAPRTHDGFFLRLSAGLGGAKTAIDVPGSGGSTELSFSGPGGDMNFAIGGMVSPNLALHGTIFGWSLTNPDAEFGALTGEFDGDVSMGAVGPGLTWYLMPANFYLSASIGLATLRAENDYLEAESDQGLAMDFTFGKEWWVGNAWGLGLAGSLGYSSISADAADETWQGVSYGLRFSATLN